MQIVQILQKNTPLITVKCMYIKFSDKQLKLVSDSISECLFCKNFLGGMPPDPLEDLCFALYWCASHCASVLHTAPACFAHQDTTPLPCDHTISEIANQNLVLIGHSILAIIFPYIVLWANYRTDMKIVLCISNSFRWFV